MKKERLIRGELSFWLLWERLDSCHVLDFLQKLKISDGQQFKKLLALLGRLSDFGPKESLKNKEKFRHETGKIFVVKSYQVRIYGFFDSRTDFVLVHATMKKRNRASQADLRVAERLRLRYVETKGEQK